MPNQSDSPINHIVNKLPIWTVPILLIVLLIGLIFVAQSAISQGKNIDMFGFKIDSNTKCEHLPTKDFIATLPLEVQGTQETSKEKIQNIISSSRDKSNHITSLEHNLTNLKNQKVVLENQINAMNEQQDKFLNKILRLEDQITRWEGSINTNVKVNDKKDTFLLVQELLMRIGYYNGAIDGNPITAQKALIEYKKAKNFKDENLWSHVTHQTVIFMMSDYANTLLKESRG